MPLPSRAFSHARGHLRVSDVLLDGPRKKRDCSSSLLHSFNKAYLKVIDPLDLLVND